jgi:hypothetical protein
VGSMEASRPPSCAVGGIVMSYQPTRYENADFWISIGSLPGWRDKAACLDEDPELFFPSGTTGRALQQIEEAKAVCRRCPVIKQCLQWALETNEQYGVGEVKRNGGH